MEAAAALSSSIDLAKELFPALANLDMACGADVGKVLVGRVGLKGDKEVTVLGRSVPCASGLQQHAGDGFTAISARLWDGIEQILQSYFDLKDGRRIADIDIVRVEAKKAARAFPSRVKVGGTLSGGVTFTEVAEGGIKPARSWGE